MLALAAGYHQAMEVERVTAAVAGLRAIVVALVANAAWIFARSSLRSALDAAVSIVTAVLFFFGESPFLIVAGAGMAGMMLFRPQAQTGLLSSTVKAKLTAALRYPVWVLGFAILFVFTVFVLSKQLVALAFVMMKVDAFAFGGGLAAVPLMFREIVDARSWIPAHVFMDGIALGQVTPGPIVITATFVGYQIAGFGGAATATVAMFLPSLFMLVLAEPWFRRFHSSPVVQGAGHALVLSFIGLLASVTVQFASFTTWNAASVAIAGLAMVALLLNVEMSWVVLVGALISAVVM